MQRTLSLAASILVALPQVSTAAGPFDGTWSVTQDCTAGAQGGARGYKYLFDVVVTNGNLSGQYGTKGHPASETLTGRVEPDGSASLVATGLTGKSETTIGFVQPGTPFSFPAEARFEATKGSGKRTVGRPCAFTFIKK